MKNLKRLILCGLLTFGFTFGCVTTEPERVCRPETAEQPYTIQTNGTIRIKFSPDYLPDNAKTVEIIYDGKYLGYYSVTDLIYLPSKTGRISLTANFSDADQNPVLSKTYYLNL